MRRILIKKVGPIEYADLTLNRYNVFIGKQSSGKSTIAKIVSNCTWMEKEVATHPYNPVSVYENTYKVELVVFHNMEGYVKDDAYILYDSDYVTIELKDGQCAITRKPAMEGYLRKKTLYIPSERNIVVYSDGIGGANNLRSFAADWQSAREVFDEKNKQAVLDLGLSYYKKGENGKSTNQIVSTSKGKEYDIDLKSGSSGLQSVIPITVSIDFFTGVAYNPKVQSDLLKANDKHSLQQLSEYYVRIHKDEVLTGPVESVMKNLLGEISGLVSLNSTSFVIEEPENNLFPETQYALMKYLFTCMNRDGRRHEMTITTHSPYILSTLNIFLMAGRLMDVAGMDADVLKISEGTYIEGGELSVWSVERGGVKPIIDKQTGMISENYLDTVSDVLGGKFNELYRLFLQMLRNKK